MTSKRTLIAYATKGGATREASSEIAKVLIEKYKLEVDLADLRKGPFPDAAEYANVVIGGGVRAGKAYGEFLKFMGSDLKGKKVAIFISSLEPEDQAIAKYLSPALEAHPGMKPVATGVMGGAMRILGRTIQDKRDAKKVAAWADKVGRAFSGR